jgi:hypothetical protein
MTMYRAGEAVGYDWLQRMVKEGALVPVEPEHQHQWLPWLALPNGSSWTQCTGCGEEVQFDHQ